MATAGGQGGGGGGGGDEGASAAQLPDPANATIKEDPGKGKCCIHYHYTVEKGDQVTWTLEGDRGGDFYILFTVKRLNSDRIVFLRKSKLIPGKLRESIVVTGKSLERKKGWYKVELEKKTDFNVANFFLPDSPPV